MFLLFEEKQKPKIDNWNFWFWVFCVQHWPFHDCYLVSGNSVLGGLLKPGVYAFLGQVVIKGSFD